MKYIDYLKIAIQYYLIRATNENADRVYKNFKDAQLSEAPFLRKYLREDVFCYDEG